MFDFQLPAHDLEGMLSVNRFFEPTAVVGHENIELEVIDLFEPGQ